MKLIVIEKALAGTLVTEPSSDPGARPVHRCSYERYALECTLYSVQYTQILCTIITEEDNNDDANKQIVELITQKRFASQNGHYTRKLTCQCENIILSDFTLLQSKIYF